VKEFLKSANISQSYERISSGTFLWLTVYILVKFDGVGQQVTEIGMLYWGTVGAIAIFA